MRNWVGLGAVPVALLTFAACTDTGVAPELATEEARRGPPSGEFTTASSHQVLDGEAIPLIAGQNIEVGSVTVEDLGDSFRVTYETTGDWCIFEVHFDVGDEYADLQQNKAGNPKVGHFDYNEDDLDCVTEHTFVLSKEDAGVSAEGPYAMAAHAVVQRCEVVDGEETPFLFGTLDEAGSGGNEGDIYRVDPTTGDAVLLYDFASDPSADPFSPNGLIYAEDTDRLYFSVQDGSSADIYWVAADGSSAGPTLFAENLPHQIYNASWHDGGYYFIPNEDDDILRLDLTTGALTTECTDILGGAELFFGDIAISDDGLLYGWARVGANSTDYRFFRVNLDGCVVEVNQMVDPDFNIQLALGELGRLWGHQALSAEGDDVGRWYEVNKDTGELSADFQTSPSFTDISAGFLGGDGERMCTQEETAWAQGDSFQGSNWAMWFQFGEGVLN